MSDPSSRRGGIAVVVAVSTATLVMAMALAVDVGLARLQGAELHAATDAAALGGAMGLRDPDRVQGIAESIAAANPVGGDPLSLATVEIGWWDDATSSFTADPAGDAVQVTATHRTPALLSRIGGFRFLDVPRLSIAQRERSFVRCGVIGADDARWWGNGSIDSYDATVGPYGGFNRGEDAGVCSNGRMRVGGNGTIFGDASAGVGHSPEVSGSGEITGTAGWLLEDIEIPVLDWEEARANNDNAALGHDTPLRITERTTVLGPGKVLLDALRMRGQDEIVVVPPLELWIDGPLDMAGKGIVNPTGDPADLKVYVRGPQVDLRGTADFYGSVVAPTADVRFRGTADFYGNMLGQTVDISGTGAIHMDDSLPLVVDPMMTGGPAHLVR